MRSATFRRILRQPGGLVGVVLLAVILLFAFLGPIFAPYSPTQTLFAPSTPGNGLVLGSDFLGRDVLSRLLHGGRSVILIGVSATLSAYIIGVVAGLVAGYKRGFGDAVVLRLADVVVAFPPLLVLLLLIGGFGRHVWILIVGVIVVQTPSIARITRTATLSASKTPYVEAAHARGDTTATILRKDVLPNILPTLLADFGVRFAVSIVLVAGINYLGLGLAPPASDWGLMMTENQDGISLNPAAVLAPAIALAALTVSCNLIGDAYIRAITSSREVAPARAGGPAGLSAAPAVAAGTSGAPETPGDPGRP